MRRIGFLSFALLTVVMVAAPVSAQTAQRFSIQFSGLSAQFTAIQSEEAAFGQGGELQFRYNPSAFSIGIGFQRTTHTFTDVVFGGFVFPQVDLIYDGVFIEPRYVLDVGSEHIAPYLSGRAMALTPTLELPGVGSAEGTDGVAIAGGGGLLIVLGSRVNLDAGVTAGKEFYDGEESIGGTTVVTRIGLAIGLF